MFEGQFVNDLNEFVLLDVFGRAVRNAEFLFVGCAIDATYDRPQFSSKECVSDDLPRQMTDWEETTGEQVSSTEASVFWGAARILSLFHLPPCFAVLSESYIQQPFLAIDLSGEILRGIPFLWTNADGHFHDYYHSYPDGIARIAFTPRTDQSQRERIALRFWELLFSDLEQVQSYTQVFEGGRISYDSKNRTTVYIEELETYDDDFLDGHQAAPGRCDDCGGVGEEYIKYPIRQKCETCFGNGWVTWPPRRDSNW